METPVRMLLPVFHFSKEDSDVNASQAGKDHCVNLISMTVLSFLVSSMPTVQTWSTTSAVLAPKDLLERDARLRWTFAKLNLVNTVSASIGSSNMNAFATQDGREMLVMYQSTNA